MKSDKVDPAALLIAVLPFAQTPLTTAGAWDPMNTVLALVVFTVLWGYALADPRRRQARTPAEAVALSVVIGLVSAIALAFPVQALLSGKLTSAPLEQGGPSDSDITLATWLSLGIGLIIAVALAAWLRRSRTRSSEVPLVDSLQRLTDEVGRLREALERLPEPPSMPSGRAANPAGEQARLRPSLVALANFIRRSWRPRGETD